jgi:hypothetical protein
MNSTNYIFRLMTFLLILLSGIQSAYSINRISIASGDWNTSATWSPSGSPAPTDNITIAQGHTITVSTNQTIHTVIVDVGGKLTWATGNTLSVTGNLMVNGTVNMNGGNISLTNSGLMFQLGSSSVFTWDPGTNTIAGTSLFINGVESFSPTSTLIIKKWYDYLVPLTNYVSGNFGNLEMNSFTGTAVAEWNQNNGFQQHQVMGTLSIDTGWVTLDKSGTISNTTIGNIVLKNINSTIYLHHGTHPGIFTFTTGSITNNGGTFYGINNGNGNITLHVTGNFNNYGNVKVINNTGYAGVSNGNATFTVDSTFSQSGGDTRIIYNVSTTNSGLFSATFRNIQLTGGIFMGQSGCRTTGGLCSMNIIQNLSIQFQNSTDKFREASISSIGNSLNTVLVNMYIGGNLTISGSLNSEVTSSAAGGTENVTVNGTTSISGCNVSFNYGAPTASHSNTLIFNNHLSVTGGIVFLSRNNGISTITLNGNLAVSAGQFTIKGGDGATNMTVTGTYSQTGGQVWIHNNSSTPATVPFTFNIQNNFSQVSGLFSFDSNTSNSSANHSVIVSGSTFTVGGNGSMTRAGVGTCTSFGILNFKRAGLITYSRNSTFAVVSQVKQVIHPGCTVKVVTGNFLAASYPVQGNDMVTVLRGGTLNLGVNQVASNGTYPYSFLSVDSNATIVTQRAQGFYDGTLTACVSSNMTYSLNMFSTIEYNGTANQVVTGNFSGIPPTQNQYGILKVNMGNPIAKAMMINPVIVRTRLILTNGELNLGGKTITINIGTPQALVRTNGYINGELASLIPGTIIWKNMTKGLHEFPFGISSATYLPVRMFVMVAINNDVSASTYAALGLDNLPLPIVSNAAVSLSTLAANYATTNLIDRWWNISAPGVIAGLTVSYKGIENTIDPAFQLGQLGIVNWTGSSWSAPAATGSGVIAGIGTVSAEIMTDFSAMSVGRQTGLKTVCGLRNFTAEQIGNEIALNWSTELEINCDFFAIERSTDGTNFEEMTREKSSGTTSGIMRYNSIDHHPAEGTMYYRIRQTSQNGISTYSEVQEINYTMFKSVLLTIDSFGPNPFDAGFEVKYKLGSDAIVHFELSGTNGQLLEQSEVKETEGNHTFSFDKGSSLQPGIYFLKVTSGETVIVKKLVRK